MNENEQTTGEPVRLRGIEGGRAELERKALLAVALGQPDAEVLARRLRRPANVNLSVVPADDSKTTLQRSS